MNASPPAATFGHYRLLRTLSSGARGTVYEAFDPDQRRQVALRVVPAPPGGSRRGLLQGWRARRRDAAMARLAHPAIIPVLAQGQVGEAAFVATEFVEGDALPAYLKRVGPLPVLQGLALALQLLDALTFAHRHGQVHGAVQPDNLLVTRNGQLRVAGFGWAAGMPGAAVPGRFHVPAYLAPEQGRGAAADAHADLYSAALVARMLLGGGTPAQPAPLPPKLAFVFGRALAARPQARFPDAASLGSALQDAVGAPDWNRDAPRPAQAGAMATAPGAPVASRVVAVAKPPAPQPPPDAHDSPSPDPAHRTVQTGAVPGTRAETDVFTRFGSASLPAPTPPQARAEPVPVPVPVPQSSACAPALAPGDTRSRSASVPLASTARPPAGHERQAVLRHRGIAVAAIAAVAALGLALVLRDDPTPAQIAVAQVQNETETETETVTETKAAPVAPTAPQPAAAVAPPAIPHPAVAATPPLPQPVIAPTPASARPMAAPDPGRRLPRNTARSEPQRSPTRATQAQAAVAPKPPPGRRAEPRRQPLAIETQVGCRQDLALTREVCIAIRCASDEWQRHPACVRRVAQQRARDAERELNGGGG